MAMTFISSSRFSRHASLALYRRNELADIPVLYLASLGIAYEVVCGSGGAMLKLLRPVLRRRAPLAVGTNISRTDRNC